jgi:hypothetical protein
MKKSIGNEKKLKLSKETITTLITGVLVNAAGAGADSDLGPISPPTGVLCPGDITW